MNGIKCPYCNQISEDAEFCDFCGRSIEGIEKIEEVEEKVVHKTKWTESTIKCHSVMCKNCPDEEGFLKTIDLKMLHNLIEIPIKYEKNEENYILNFLEDKAVDLETWIHGKTKLEFKEIISIVKRIHKIVSDLNSSGYILGSFDISDFWIKDDDINTIKLRQVRPFIKQHNISTNFKIGEFYAPEVKNGDLDNIGYCSDVFVIGKLLLTMLLWHKDLTDYTELRYISHQLGLFSIDIPSEIRYWIGKSTSIFTEERYENVDKQFEALESILKKHEERQFDLKIDYIFNHAEKSHVGLGKSRTSSLENAEFLNEDSYIYLEGKGDINNVLAIVADGISNCKYGSGYKASNHIINVAKELWEERNNEIYSKEKVEKFFYDLIKISSEKIMKEALKDIPLNEAGYPESHIFSSDIMGSTLAAAILIEDKAYTVSLGDSRIYLDHKVDGISLLNVDDNYMNQCVKNNMPWAEIKTLENKSSLTKVLGGADTKEWPFTTFSVQMDVKETKLLKDEILMLCSDGVTDYITAIGHRSDEWNVDFKIHEILFEEREKDHSLDEIAERFIEESNCNGGGDNITVVLIKAV